MPESLPEMPGQGHIGPPAVPQCPKCSSKKVHYRPNGTYRCEECAWVGSMTQLARK